MGNPFDDHDGAFFALTAVPNSSSHDLRRSLWPAFLEVPAGWTVEFGPASREAVLGHIERVDTRRK